MASTIHLSHFTAAIIFSFFTAIVFGIALKPTPKEMISEGLRYFAYFVGGTFLAGWLMALLRMWAGHQ
jgi:H+/gluconate symporter-like permease